jgi:hypothetical protein
VFRKEDFGREGCNGGAERKIGGSLTWKDERMYKILLLSF